MNRIKDHGLDGSLMMNPMVLNLNLEKFHLKDTTIRYTLEPVNATLIGATFHFLEPSQLTPHITSHHQRSA